MGRFGAWTGVAQARRVKIEKAPAELRLQMTGGLIAHYRDRGDVQVLLYPAGEVEGLAVDQASVPPDGETRTITLRTEHVGLHRIEFADGGDMTRIMWDARQPMIYESSINYAPSHVGRQNTYFYVPRGTKVVGGYASGSKGSMHDEQGNKVYQLNEPGFFEVPVPPGQGGMLWSLRSYSGKVQLMTVPPYMSHDASQLLLPREVVEGDSNE